MKPHYLLPKSLIIFLCPAVMNFNIFGHLAYDVYEDGKGSRSKRMI